jgi:hypothetical protein
MKKERPVCVHMYAFMCVCVFVCRRSCTSINAHNYDDDEYYHIFACIMQLSYTKMHTCMHLIRMSTQV